MTRRIITLLYLIIITPNIIIAQNKIAKDILDQLSEKGQTYEDITAEFKGSFSNNNQGIYEDISGKIWIKGDMYKLDLYEEDLAIINNGKTVWYFMKDIPEVQIMDNNPDEEINPSKIFTIYEYNYEYKYNGAESIDGIRSHSISLFPKENNQIEKIILLVDAEKITIKGIRIYDIDKGETIYNITNFITNSSIDKDTFKFTKENHPDVEIIDLR